MLWPPQHPGTRAEPPAVGSGHLGVFSGVGGHPDAWVPSLPTPYPPTHPPPPRTEAASETAKMVKILLLSLETQNSKPKPPILGLQRRLWGQREDEKSLGWVRKRWI